MKFFKKCTALVLAMILAAGALVGCGCDHVDEDLNGKCDLCGDDFSSEGAEVTKEEWESAFKLTKGEEDATLKLGNVKMNVVEVAYYNGQKVNESNTDYFAVDGVFYNKDGVEEGKVSAFSPYVPFSAGYSNFTYSEKSGSYTCYSITAGGISYRNAVVTFGSDKRLESIVFEVEQSYYVYRVTVKFRSYGTTVKPERDPFVFEGEEASKYATTRDVEGHKLAYITITVKGYGDIKLLLDATAAPETVSHILKLIDERFYDGLTFHRVIDNFMIQGGCPDGNGTGNYKDKDGNKVTIKGEFSSNGYTGNDIKHLRGVISMARGDNKDSASSQFFICNADCSSLDGNYATFGYVLDGMSVVDKITYDTKVYGNSNGSISDKTKHAVIEKIIINDLVGITLDGLGAGSNELPVDPAE